MEKNIITAKLVQKHVLNNPFLVDYLNREIINVAGLARELLPIIKKENKKATIESISVAINRLDLKKERVSERLRKIVSDVQITSRTDVVLFCLKKGTLLPDMKDFKGDDIFFVNQGADEVTVIIDRKNAKMIKGNILVKKEDLAIISLKDTHLEEIDNYRVTPGFVYLFLDGISREGINIEDILSTYSQVTFVVEQKNALEVFRICQAVKSLEYY